MRARAAVSVGAKLSFMHITAVFRDSCCFIGKSYAFCRHPVFICRAALGAGWSSKSRRHESKIERAVIRLTDFVMYFCVCLQQNMPGTALQKFVSSLPIVSPAFGDAQGGGNLAVVQTALEFQTQGFFESAHRDPEGRAWGSCEKHRRVRSCASLCRGKYRRVVHFHGNRRSRLIGLLIARPLMALGGWLSTNATARMPWHCCFRPASVTRSSDRSCE